MKRITITLAIVSLVAASSAFAVEIKSFEDLDTDHNGMLSREEASADATLAQQFDDLDTNKDGQLSHEEYDNAEE